MERDEVSIDILKFQHETAWDALRFWANDLNKLIYWQVMLYGGMIALLSQNLIVFSPIICLGSVMWLHQFKRAVFWYGVNLRYVREIRRRLADQCGEDVFIYDQLHELLPDKLSLFRGSALATLTTSALILLALCLDQFYPVPEQTIRVPRICSIGVWIPVIALLAWVIKTPAHRIRWVARGDQAETHEPGDG